MSKSDNPLISHERQLSVAIDELAEHFVLFDAEDRIVLANKAWQEMNRAVIEYCTPGTKFEDHLRAAINKGLIPEAIGREDEWLRERMERHLHPRGPFEVARQDGVWVLIHEQRLANNETILVISDISELKRVEEGSRASEERFQAFFKNLPAKMHIKDPQGRYILINPVTEKIFGVSNEDAIGKTVTDIFPEHQGEIFDSHDKAVLKTGAATTIEENFSGEDGPSTFLTVKFPIHDAGGNVVAVGASGIDITARKRVEQALQDAHRELERRVEERTQQLQAEIEQRIEIANNLKESEERFRDIAESSSDWFWEMGPDLTFTYFDESFREIAGIDPKSYLGMTRREIAVGNSDNPKWQQHLDDLDNHRSFRDFQYELKRPDGTSQHVSISGTPAFDANGEFKGYRGAGTNVTAQVESERRAIKAQEEMRRAKEEAEKASHAKSDFLASMSHELRTPMNAILGFAQLLELDDEEPLTETQKEYVQHILDGGEHLLNLIADVLELNKIEEGRLSLSMGRVSVKDVIEECLHQIQFRAEDSEIQIIDRCTQGKLPWLWSDATRLKQVLLNLLANAIKYNHPRGSVVVSCEELPEQRLRIIVSDTGDGIPSDRYADLFAPFERLGREAGKVEGTGIGLTIAKRIIENLDGEIGFESEEGQGSTFWVDVPLSDRMDADVEEPLTQIVEDSHPITRESGNGQHTVLYIEDNPANMRLMENIVGQFANISMLSAYNAELGLDLARQHIPDLIFMDINLPGMNGIEAMQELKRFPATESIPVIAISADAMPRDIENAMENGFRDYITKPINVAETYQAIANIIKQ